MDYFCPIYVHKYCNHSIQILEKLAKAIGKRIPIISSSKEIFEISSKIGYKDELKISGYKEGLVYKNSSLDKNDQNEKKKKKCNIIWYNLSYSANGKINRGQKSV